MPGAHGRATAEANAIADDAIRAIGPLAARFRILAEITRRCDVAGLQRPSDASVTARIARQRWLAEYEPGRGMRLVVDQIVMRDARAGGGDDLLLTLAIRARSARGRTPARPAATDPRQRQRRDRTDARDQAGRLAAPPRRADRHRNAPGHARRRIRAPRPGGRPPRGPRRGSRSRRHPQSGRIGRDQRSRRRSAGSRRRRPRTRCRPWEEHAAVPSFRMGAGGSRRRIHDAVGLKKHRRAGRIVVGGKFVSVTEALS